jgi:hypothetical protein
MIRSESLPLLFAILFPIFTFIALGIDSTWFLHQYCDGRQLTNILAIGYFLLLYFYSGSRLRKLMVVMVPLSYIGEIIFCKLLGMYTYRTSLIPLYVPFGHAIVYASGYIIAHQAVITRHGSPLRIFFAIGFSLMFLLVGIYLNDIFSLVFGALFFLLLKRKRWDNLYYFVAICVIIIELIGTYFGCWAWASKTFGYIPTINPPMGAVFFYAGGDVLLAKIVSIWEKKSKQAMAA